MTTVVVPKKIPSFTVKAQNGVFSQNPSTSTTLVNQGLQNTFGSLTDLVPSNVAGILYYDPIDNKYKVLPIEQTASTLNGGEF